MEFDQLYEIAKKSIIDRGLPETYLERLAFERQSILDQGAERYWTDLVTARTKFDSNKNGLLLPWLLHMLTGEANVDPIITRGEPLVLSSNHVYIKGLIEQIGRVPKDIKLDSDKPDIDIDCLPAARDEIKAYASQRFGDDKVASVGTWTTFQFKNALGEVYGALNLDESEVDYQYNHLGLRKEPGKHLGNALTVNLPEDVNELRKEGKGVCKGQVIVDGVTKDCEFDHAELVCPKCGASETDTPTLPQLLKDYDLLNNFYHLSEDHKRVVHLASRLIGCVRTTGKHAGAIIIADRELYGNVPMLYDSKAKQWVSLWTEGRNTQLSKFGYNKWDILGLKTLLYIYVCCGMIEENHGVSFGKGLVGLEQNDPTLDRAGVYWKDGEQFDIPLNDPDAIRMADQVHVSSVFQFDTDVARGILKNGVTSFNDLLTYNALGHPGPMQMIPTYVARRDGDDTKWRDGLHPKMRQVLDDTYGVIVYQEDLAALWTNVGGFTTVEAQDARKAVAKKWKDKLKPIEEKWVTGAAPIIGEASARDWWGKMETFGRYAFNKCLDAETVLHDPIANTDHTIEERFYDECPFYLHARGNAGWMTDQCVAIHDTGMQEVFEVTFDDGTIERVTIDHKFLCSDGEYHTVRDIVVNDLDIIKQEIHEFCN